MLNLYCIPGMGVDARLFKNLRADKCTIRHVKWLTPYPDESLPSYAMRLSEQIDTTQPFALAGVSFGGMCSVEIAKRLNPVRTFVISSCKTSSELPLKLTLWRYFTLYKLLSDERYISGAMLVRKQFGVSSPEQAAKFREMLRSAPPDYFRGAVHCIMNWKNGEVPPGVVQIHGSADRVLPIRKISCNYTVRNGTHYMIVDRAAEINAIMEKELQPFLP